MKKIHLLWCIALIAIALMPGRSNAQLLSGYNQQFYTSVFDAAEGIAMPFLLQQGYMTMPGVEIYQDTMLTYNGQTYTILSRYQNPEGGDTNGYFLERNQYGAYQIEIFSNVWPLKIPNILYNYTGFTFSSLADCVGYGTRVLSAIGDTTQSGNAYLSLISKIKDANTTLIADRGYVASAYQIGAAFPTLPDAGPGTGWQYVAGNVMADSINAYNHSVDPTINQYNGRIKGGYSSSQQGDILSFAYAPDLSANGHFMVLADEPYLINFDTLNHIYTHVPDSAIQNFLATYNVYGTPVYDCSGRRAHFHDSRAFMSGIGHGTLYILTEPGTDIPAGFIFEPPSDTASAIRPFLVDGIHTWAISVGRYNGVTGIGNNGNNEIPATHHLEQNYPNPFNPATSIRFHLPAAGFVKLTIFDIAGRELETIAGGEFNAGIHEINWNASSYPSGVYFYQLKAGEFVQTRKMILNK